MLIAAKEELKGPVRAFGKNNIHNIYVMDDLHEDGNFQNEG